MAPGAFHTPRQRGRNKKRMAIDDWIKQLAPSTELRQIVFGGADSTANRARARHSAHAMIYRDRALPPSTARRRLAQPRHSWRAPEWPHAASGDLVHMDPEHDVTLRKRIRR